MKKPVKTINAPQAIGPYNQGIISGNMIFISGQIPFTKDGNLISEDIGEQTAQCLTNIDNILKEAGFDKRNIVKTTIFITDMNNFAKVNEVYKSFFETTIFPARSTIEVSRLPKDAGIEIEAIAEIDIY